MRIALVGKSCSGKDTVAKELGLPTYAFANGLKEEIVGLMAIHGIHITIDDINKDKAKYRPLLQSWGTDFKRTFIDKDYWVKRLLTNITTEDAVVTDVRFPNEVKALEDAGFVIIHLKVSREVQKERYTKLYGQDLTEAQLNHPSETALDDTYFEYTINADYPLELVVEMVKVFYRQSQLRIESWSSSGP